MADYVIPRAWVITLGNEVLLGEVENTNAGWLARRLTSIGIAVRRIVTSPDDEESVEVLREAIESADVVVSTGGLGPTYDDRTMYLLSRALGLPLETNPRALEVVKRRAAERGFQLTPARLKMAEMPVGAEALENRVGTAPGAVLRRGSTIIIVLPGVPAEMMQMFDEAAEVYLKGIGRGPPCRREATFEGIVEADLAGALLELSRDSSVYVKTQPRGKPGMPAVRILVISFKGNCDEAFRRLEEAARSAGGRLLGE
ncbi:MAG: molybdopterin-binding protein [Conexivisphaera sp.]|jgi:molybdenum cofactor synthesis domain-containing protein